MGRMRRRVKSGKRSKRQEPDQVKKIKTKLYEIFAVNDGNAYDYQALIKKLKLPNKKSKDYLKDWLFSLESKEKIRRLSDGRFVSNAESKYIRGTVDHVNPNFAYVVTSENEDDIWVKTADLHFAIHGDRVNVLITRPAGKRSGPKGKVIKLLQRNQEEFVGRIEIYGNFSFVVPDNRNIHFDIMVYPEKIGKAKPKDKVLVKIDRWHNAKNRSPLGTITEILGQAGEHETEIYALMAEFGLPFRFPKKIEKAAEDIPDLITDEEIRKRRDFRGITTFTIDPHDAKDFDDALSIKEPERGKYEIGVHIADVSYYLEEGSALDREAMSRGTSVYLVDRTIPMLPERLSNDLCSLRPDEEKLTFSVVFEMDAKGRIYDKWFGRTIIKSTRRFTYEEAQERIEGQSADFSDEIRILNHLAKQLRKKRIQQGAVNFETVEVKFRLDEKGTPLEVIPKVRKDAHKMIEEFMLLANKEVATHIFKWREKGIGDGSRTFIYRIHDDPDPERLSTFALFAAKFGRKLDLGKNLSESLNRLMEEIAGRPEQNILESLAIRSMAKAKYTTDPGKHFGLAFDHYTHFTSPIRRYPDVIVHRLLGHYLQKGKDVGNDEYEPLCVHSSEREKRAVEAERASIKYKQVEFMQTMLGQEFEGIVSGVTEWGIFVEIIETKCEGMIRVTNLDDDFYEFDEKQMCVIGRNNKRMITLGDTLKVLIAKTDIDRRTIDLEMVYE
ncbi:MAG: ribonuclease R [Ekhidna sp.]|nr:ribonuclease R [Ekhidna sp.]